MTFINTTFTDYIDDIWIKLQANFVYFNLEKNIPFYPKTRQGYRDKAISLASVCLSVLFCLRHIRPRLRVAYKNIRC